MATDKAPANGQYTREGIAVPFRIREGDAIPEGGTFIAHDDKKPVGKRAKGKASENRAKPASNENREKAD